MELAWGWFVSAWGMALGKKTGLETKRRPAPCLHLSAANPTAEPATLQTQPALGKGRKNQSCSGSGCRGEEGKGPCQKGLLLLLLLASRRRRGEPRGGRAEPGGEQSCWQLGWGGEKELKKKTLLLPRCLLLLL